MEMSMMERLERLEQQNRWFKGIFISMSLVISSFVLMGQSSPLVQEVKAQKFSLYDASGKNRGMFFARDGQAILILSDPNGEPRITLAVGKDGAPGIGLSDKGDKVRAEISVAKGNPRLALLSREERERILLQVGTDGSPRIGLMDSSKSPRIVIGGTGDNWGVGLFDQKGSMTATLGEKR